MNRRTGSLVAVIFTIAIAPALAQWLNAPTKGIPRTKDGKADLSAPALRKPDGSPDLSGVWRGDPQSEKYFQNVAADFKPDDFPIRPWAETLTKERAAAGRDWPLAHCLPAGVALQDTAAIPYPLKIIQEPDLIVMLFELFGQFRQIFLDGRALPINPNPTWSGYSVGRWDGDTLIVETAGFNGKTWLDAAGHPATDALHITERFWRRDFGHMDLQLTIDDPKAYTKPWTVSLSWHLWLDTELMEYICNENEKDLKHIVAK
jgi:hypothetical protein